MSKKIDPLDYCDPEDAEGYEVDGDTINKALECMELFNVFLIYYKQLFQKDADEHMFTGIKMDEDDSTNRSMELLFEEMHKFKICPFEDKDVLYPPGELNIEDCEELYLLTINNKNAKVCKTIIPILKCISKMDYTVINWSIIPMKTDH